MGTLSNKYIARSYYGYLHADGKELPETGRVLLYDGNGNESSLYVGREGEGVLVDGPLQVGELKYPEGGSEEMVGSVVTHLSSGQLAIKPYKNLLLEIIDIMFPIGTVTVSVRDENPSDRLVGTRWERVGEAQVLIGIGDNAVFEVESNEYAYNKIVDIPPHYHGVGRFSRGSIDGWTGSSNATENNDNTLNITARNLPLPQKGWESKDKSYAGRISRGNAGGTNYFATLSSGYDQDKAMVTTTQLSFEDGSSQQQVELDITPPSYGVYIWKRIS